MSKDERVGQLFSPTVPMMLYFDGLTQNLKQDLDVTTSGFHPKHDHSKGEMFLEFLEKESFFTNHSTRLRFYFPNQQLTTTDVFMFLEEITIEDKYLVKKVLLKDRVGYTIESMFYLKIRDALGAVKNELKKVTK